MQHSVTPPQVETLEELGTKIAQLRYDAIIVLLTEMSNEFDRQAATDRKRRYVKLAGHSFDVNAGLDRAIRGLEKMLHISTRHMEESFKTTPPCYLKNK